jgi:hypothetical protein
MRAFRRNPAWQKRDIFLITMGCIFVPFDMLSVILALAAKGPQGFGSAAFSALLVVVGLIGLYRELPLSSEAEAAPPQGAYRMGPDAPPEPSRVSRLGRGLLGVYVLIHLALIVLAIAALFLFIVIAGLLIAVCSKH